VGNGATLQVPPVMLKRAVALGTVTGTTDGGAIKPIAVVPMFVTVMMPVFADVPPVFRAGEGAENRTSIAVMTNGNLVVAPPAVVTPM